MLSFADRPVQHVWSAQRLRMVLRERYGSESIVVLSNREPYRHDHGGDRRIAVHRSPGGLVAALEPLMQACSGVWVAHGAGTADRAVVDSRDGVAVPPANPQYRLRRVWLDQHEERGYYYGFANEGLWPLCHRTSVAPIFRPGDFAMYRRVNRRFAEAVCDEVRTARPLVVVQDYHFAIAPQEIRRRLPLATIVAFWHVPWPSLDDLADCPQSMALVEGLLSSTIVGCQTPDDCRNFMDAAEGLLNARSDRLRGLIRHNGRTTSVAAYPVSIEWPNRWLSQSPPVDECRTHVRREFQLANDGLLAVGVDRMDYTKGLEEKFLVVERLLDTCPDLCNRFVLVQVAEPSRTCLGAYRELAVRLRSTADRINRRFATSNWQPIHLRDTRHEPPDVYRLMRAADVCYVGSLHDGMNLVAKEFVAAREDEQGVLVLSEFAGAARELAMALVVNPYAIDDCAATLRQALRMPAAEQRIRMRAMRSQVIEHNAYAWAASIVADAAARRAGAGAGRVPTSGCAATPIPA